MNPIFILILGVGVFLRSFKPLQLFMYSHDQDLAGWIIKDVLINHHIRLIGQETSSHGVFIGPLYYYLQIPFYLLSRMDPKGALLLSILLGAAGIFSFYYVFKKVFDEKTGLLACLIYSVSTVLVFTDREVVPTMPVALWSVWFFYGVNQILKGNQKAYILLGILLGLVWHINLALGVLFPLIFLAQVFSKTKIDFKKILTGSIFCLLLISPFIVFELRHNYQQVKAIVTSVTTDNNYIEGTKKGLGKLDRVIQLVQRNTNNIYWGVNNNIPVRLTLYGLIFGFVVLSLKRKIDWRLSLVAMLWQGLFILFFTLNSINVSEYYLNGMNVIWIMILALSIRHLINNKNLAFLGNFLIIVFLLANIKDFFTREVNRSGYLERKGIVKFINNDAKNHNYPCVSVSYITSPGNDLGYRYLFWLEKMRVEQPKSGAPVYTIVYPLSKVSRVDQKFGVIGLILPDYERYNRKGIVYSCSGGNSNLTDPMFGYTE